MSLCFYEPLYDFDTFLDDALNTRLLSNMKDRASICRPSDVQPSEGAITTLKPRMDLVENPEKNQVTAVFELPGLTKEDTNIEVNNNRMTVSGESKETTKKEEGGYLVNERRVGRFSRTLQLPPGVKEDQIKAHLDNGVLTVTFPKTSKEQEQKKITIN